jgi:hypothetical protein
MVQRNILCNYGNPSKVFMCLELGIIPVRFVIIKGRLKFLKYILDENISTMMRQVYETLKKDSRKGDFVDLVNRDLEEINIDYTEEEIMHTSKVYWKKYASEKVKDAAFNYLVKENEEKTKTKHIYFDNLEMSKYLVRNKSTSLSKIIFSVRAGIFDVKVWNEWSYRDKSCVMCQTEDEDMNHFMKCSAYGKGPFEMNWTNIYENDPDEQNLIAVEVRRRYSIRQLKVNEVGLPPLNLAPLLQ